MGDVQSYETPIMSMDEFKIGLLDKGAVHGVMLRSDENGYYNIGIQINDREVVKVASALEDDAMQKIQYWSEKVDDVRNQFKDRKPKLKPFDENN
jgi:ABC-type Fe3+-hydroxamate transport system substrate-binding protein